VTRTETDHARDIEGQRQHVVEKYGPWLSHNIRIAGEVYTMGPGAQHDSGLLARSVLQIVSDLGGRPISELRILDLACLEGLYAIELAQHGAEVVGIEVREANIAKARFVKDVIGLPRLNFVQDDVRNLNETTYGSFDIVLCIGILYHLDGPDVFEFVRRMSDVCRRHLVIDTMVATRAATSLRYDGFQYDGWYYREHDPKASTAERESALEASIDNERSFWLTRASLFNLLAHAGFSSVYQVQYPAEVQNTYDRMTIVAVKGSREAVLTNPWVGERAPENVAEAQSVTLHSAQRPPLVFARGNLRNWTVYLLNRASRRLPSRWMQTLRAMEGMVVRERRP
jgi:2-polyprenyl-3-methyl-5-hydroxy-6-metoxy-1,4-benzoquinol methylase